MIGPIGVFVIFCAIIFGIYYTCWRLSTEKAKRWFSRIAIVALLTFLLFFSFFIPRTALRDLLLFFGGPILLLIIAYFIGLKGLSIRVPIENSLRNISFISGLAGGLPGLFVVALGYFVFKLPLSDVPFLLFLPLVISVVFFPQLYLTHFHQDKLRILRLFLLGFGVAICLLFMRVGAGYLLHTSGG